VVVAPVDAAGAVGLAGAGLVGVGAAGVANLADLSTEAAVCLDLDGESGFEEEVEAADGVAVEGDAVGLGGAVGELDDEAGAVLVVPGEGCVGAGEEGGEKAQHEGKSTEYRVPGTEFVGLNGRLCLVLC
jgi:hypothetical protein